MASAPSGDVLIADDDPTIVLLLEHVLEGLGRTYDVADNGATAWELWERKRHSLVVLDIEMPSLDGLSVCRRIREADSDGDTFVLIVTGRDKARDLEEVLAAGANDYLTKPTSGQRLAARLRIAQRRMEEAQARRSAEEEVQKSRWLAGIGEATVALQHEINNPLTALLGTAELMMIDARAKGQPTEELGVIIEQATRIRDLVRKVNTMRDAKSVHYAGGARMVDLRGDGKSQ